MTFNEFDGGLWIYLTYVSKNMRKKGIYKKLYKKLKKHCTDGNFTHIESSTNVNNKALRAAAESTGRSTSTVLYKWINKKAGK